MKVSTPDLNAVTVAIGALVYANGRFDFGARNDVASWLTDAGFTINGPDDVYAAIAKLNKCGAHFTGQKYFRQGTDPLPDGHRFMIVDQNTIAGEPPIWSAVPLQSGLKLETLEGQQRQLQQHQRNRRRAAKILNARKTNPSDVDPVLRITAEKTANQSALAAEAAKFSLAATNHAVVTGDTAPIEQLEDARARSYKALLKRLDNIDVPPTAPFSV